MWIAGVAVECLLRAYRARIKLEFDARHDLVEMFKQSGLYDVVERDLRRQTHDESAIRDQLDGLRAAIIAASRLWHNNYRYASEDRIRAHLRTAGAHLGIKGDFLKENARRLVEAASRIVAEGVRRWERSSGS